MPQLWPPLDPENPKAGVVPVPGYFNDDGNLQIKKVRDYLYQISAPASLPPRPENSVQAR